MALVDRPYSPPILGKICLYLPITPCLFEWSEIYEAKKTRKFGASIPKPIPLRRRALSITRQQHANTNNSAGLFSRLPYELRHIIYLHVLGNKMFPLVHIPTERRIGHFDCSTPSRGHNTHYRHKKSPSKGKLALMMTCRQIYIESSHLLYSSNTFAVIGLENLVIFSWFSRTIRAGRLASIASLYIQIQFEDQDDLSIYSFWREWVQLWDIIVTRMPGLRDITVRASKRFMLEGDRWTKPMLAVRGLRTFELEYLYDKDFNRAGSNMELDRLREQLKEHLCTPR